MRQWKDLVSQLRQMCKELKFKVGDPLPTSRPGLEIRQLPLNQQAAHSLCCAWDADCLLYTSYSPIDGTHATIMGKVVTVLRKL